jgi:hypothetical protein
MVTSVGTVLRPGLLLYSSVRKPTLIAQTQTAPLPLVAFCYGVYTSNSRSNGWKKHESSIGTICLDVASAVIWYVSRQSSPLINVYWMKLRLIMLVPSMSQ